MKARISLAVAAAFAFAAVIAPGAGASSAQSASSIKVTTVYSVVDECLAAADQYRFTYQFKAKIKKKGTTNPKKVKVTYSVDDLTTGQQVISETLNLTPRNKFKKKGTPITTIAEHSYMFKVKSIFRAPNTGKTVKVTGTDQFPVPSAAQLATLGLPACV